MDPGSIEALPMPATYGRHLLRVFEPDALLAGTGLTAADLDAPDRRITVRQALQYISNTLTLGDEPDWYLAWASRLTDHFHGPLSLALLSAPTLGDGLDAFVRYFPSRIPYMHMQSRRFGDNVLVELCPLIELGASAPLLIETPLLILHQHLETVYGVDFLDAELRLDYPRTPGADRYPRYFHCPLRFEAGVNALVMPMSWREQRNIGYSESAWAHARMQCDATLSSSRDRETLGRLSAYLCRAFDDPARSRPLPTLRHVAAELNLAPRTLIRRLQRLGTSYQRITDEFLRARALELLANDAVTVKEVAAALGYDNPANFGKTFKRWTGTSPGRYRSSAGHAGR